MTGKCFACLLAAFLFHICLSSVNVIIYKNVVLTCLQNTSSLTMCQLRIFAKFASSWLPDGCKFHSVGRQPDANFILSASIWMQISFSRPPAGCNLNPASGHAIQNTQFACGWPAINQMRFASCWRLAECKFCKKKWLAHC
jgi:hypothetical protein